MKDIGIKITPTIDSKELKGQSRLAERTEKFRLSETKKLMGQGFDFEKARRQAFKKSLMASNDIRKLEMANLKKYGTHVSKLGQAIEQIKKNTSFKAQALAGAAGGMLSSMGGGILSFLLNAAKAAPAREVEKRTAAQGYAGRIDAAERKAIVTGITEGSEKGSKLRNELIQEQSISHFASLRSMLSQRGMDTSAATLTKYAATAARMVESGAASDIGSAVNILNEGLAGNVTALAQIRSQMLKYKGKEEALYREAEFIEKVKNDSMAIARVMADSMRDFEILDRNLRAVSVGKTEKATFGELEKKKEDLMNKLGEISGNFFKFVTNFLESPGTALAGVMKTITDGMLNAFAAIPTMISNALASIDLGSFIFGKKKAAPPPPPSGAASTMAANNEEK